MFVVLIIDARKKNIAKNIANIPEHRIIMIIIRKVCEIKFSKTEKTSNLEAAMLKL